MKPIIILLIFASSALHICNAQIVNVESLRRISDSSKWSVSGSLDVGLIKNTSSIFRVNNRIRLQHNSKNNVYLFINDLNLQQIEDNSFVNRGTQHLRYNRKLGERIKFEAFAQSQYDAVSNIKFRGLLGIGPRFKLSKNKNFRYYLRTLIMYKIEEVLDSSIKILRDLSLKKRQHFLEKFTGSTQTVLMEEKKQGFWTGLTDNYIRVKVKSSKNLRNKMVAVRVEKFEERFLVGKLSTDPFLAPSRRRPR